MARRSDNADRNNNPPLPLLRDDTVVQQQPDQRGLTERPLTEPAFFDLSYQNTKGTKFFDRLTPPGEDANNMERRITSVIFAKGAKVKSYSANETGLLNLRWSGIDAKDWHLKGDAGYREWLKGLSPDDQTYLTEKLDSIPKKVTALFQEGVTVDGLVFNDFHAGGILMQAPEEAQGWKNIDFGTGNLATGSAAFTRIGRTSMSDSTKNPGGDYQIGTLELIDKTIIDGTQDWTTYSHTFTVSDEAIGQLLAVAFSKKGGGRGWVVLDDIELNINGQNLIQNGDFEQPGNTELDRRVSFRVVPYWKHMGDNIGRSGIVRSETGAIATAISSEQGRFGQVTDAVAEGGERGEIRFKMRSDNGLVIQVELLYVVRDTFSSEK